MLGVTRPTVQKRENGTNVITAEAGLAILTLALPKLTEGLAPVISIPSPQVAPVAVEPVAAAPPPAAPVAAPAAAPAANFDALGILGLDTLPSQWKTIHKQAKAMLAKHAVGSIAHDQIAKAEQWLWDTHFAKKES